VCNRNLLMAFFITALVMSFLWLSACTSLIQGGASVPVVQQSSYPVPLQFTEFRVSGAAQPQTVAGITASADLRSSTPTLYYRYDVSGQVNGNYALMPSPPQLYTISKIPFFRDEADTADVKLTLNNLSNAVISTGKAICVFELNDRTVVSAPLAVDNIVPNQTIALVVKGPRLTALGKISNQGSLDIWVYGINGAFDKDHAFHWTFPYELMTKTVTATGEVLGQTTTAAVANGYEGKVEKAPQSEQLSPPESP
jgi:hypothetical protein